MLQLPNNCRAGKFSVYPQNWKTVRAKVNCTWRVSYWFYDDNLKKKKQVVLKAGINFYETLGKKQDAVKRVMADELVDLRDKGFNPLTGTFSMPVESDISEYTLFIPALQWAFDNLKAEENTKQDMKNTLEWIKKGIVARHYDNMAIGEIRRKHIKLLLDEVGKLKVKADIPVGKSGKTKKGTWSTNQYNNYRKYLSILFTDLREVDAVESNWIRDISKQKTTRKIRKTLTEKERGEVDKYLLDNYKTFWRFLHIFFHSGSRESEMMLLKKKHVDLVNQRFVIVQKKGMVHSEEYRTIKTIALPLWKEVMDEATDEQYLFSKGLVPGNKNIRPFQITKRWYRLVKKKLGITADFYSLKHLHTTEIVNYLSEKEAAKHNGHTTTAMVRSIYDVDQVKRKATKVRDVPNSFAG